MTDETSSVSKGIVPWNNDDLTRNDNTVKNEVPTYALHKANKLYVHMGVVITSKGIIVYKGL